MSPVVYYGDVHPRPFGLASWERVKNKKPVTLFAECFAEMLGVFFYVYLGIGSVAGLVLGGILKESIANLFQVGFAFAIGILLAITVCAGTSGGHFNPGITIALSVFRGFPARKVLPYIASQILGAYIACAFVYLQWHPTFLKAEAALITAGTFKTANFTPGGPAGAFALFLPGGQTLGGAFITEFIVSALVALVIWAVIDPSNNFVSPAAGPAIISLAYAAAIWGFAPPGICLNTARDLGARLFAMTIYGTGASGGTFAAIPALVNIPGTFFAVILYEVFLTDSDRAISPSQRDFAMTAASHRRLGGGHHFPIQSDVGEVLHDHHKTLKTDA
ncbi:putative aquaporin 2 [Pluteus cervinus]|uniref:Aquaporin 2 n=1 Tax=Pluteus cervinus TaxID=181527 RepID=A0ACD3B4Q7_9AGAR|nr:putative aquaporin 2 [Pluteus cervinus]